MLVYLFTITLIFCLTGVMCKFRAEPYSTYSRSKNHKNNFLVIFFEVKKQSIIQSHQIRRSHAQEKQNS